MMDSRRVAAFALIAFGLAACGEASKPQPREPMQVRAQTLKYEDHALTIALTGEVRARVQTELSFRVSGQVIERNVDVGQHVAADTLLARIDPSEQKSDLDSANAGVGAAEAQLRQASSNFDRQKTLLATGFATKGAYDQAEQAQRTAQGTLDSALAQAGTAKDALSYTELRAGKPGTITARNIEIGQVAQPAQSAFTLAEDGPRDAVVNVYESIFFLQTEGETFDVTLASDPHVRATAHVREVSPTVDSKNGTVRVKMAIDDAPPEMSLGAAVVVTGRTKPQPAIVLPWSAFAEIDGRPAVWVIDPASKAVSLRRVEVDGFEKEKLVVKSGLKPGEQVVTEGGKMLRPGQIIQVQTGADQ
jgi:membrane fusion protein, multidrug efflux system